MAKTRTTHVFRAANLDDPDIWVDVERTDKHISVDRLSRPPYQKTTRNMFWGDEYSDEPHPTRTTTEVRIEHPDDEETFVPLSIINRMVTRRGQGQTFLKGTKIYVNDRERNQTRIYSVRRVFHWDTETDPRDDGGKEYVRIEGTEDRSQYKDVALIERIVTRSYQGIKYKKKTYRFNTAPIKEYSEPTPEEEIDLEKIVFLDPWQNIINVQWGHPFLVVGQAAGSAVVGKSPDGVEWEAVVFPGTNPYAGAFGKGHFVVVGGITNNNNWWRGSNGASLWEPIANPTPGLNVHNVVFGNGIFMALVYNPLALIDEPHDASVVTSEDGIEWRVREIPPFDGDTNLRVRGLGFSNGVFIVFGFERFIGIEYQRVAGYEFGHLDTVPPEEDVIILDPEIFQATWTKSRLSTSTDGLTWSALRDPFAHIADAEGDDLYFVSAYDGRSVTIPRTVPHIASNITNTGVWFMCNYGPEDEPEATPPVVNQPIVIGQLGNVPDTNIAVSRDGGATWVQGGLGIRDMGVASEYGTLAYGNGFFIGEGVEDESFGFANSRDGVTWTHVPGPGGGPLFAQHEQPAFGKEIFVTANVGGEIWTSEDGINWTQRTHPLGTAVLYRVIY